MTLNHDFALEGAAVPVVENPLLGQELGLLLSLGMLHVILVLGQTLLFLLLGCAVVLVHFLRGVEGIVRCQMVEDMNISEGQIRQDMLFALKFIFVLQDFKYNLKTYLWCSSGFYFKPLII